MNIKERGRVNPRSSQLSETRVGEMGGKAVWIQKGKNMRLRQRKRETGKQGQKRVSRTWAKLRKEARQGLGPRVWDKTGRIS